MRSTPGFCPGYAAIYQTLDQKRFFGCRVPCDHFLHVSSSYPYRGSVDGQRAADATGIPRLSPAAEAALGAVAAAGDEQVRGEAWRAVQADTPVAAELERFGAAVERRCGAEGVRAMLRAEGRAGAVTSASVASEQRPALDRVAQITATLKQGERAGAGLAQREAERERQGQRRGMRM